MRCAPRAGVPPTEMRFPPPSSSARHLARAERERPALAGTAECAGSRRRLARGTHEHEADGGGLPGSRTSVAPAARSRSPPARAASSRHHPPGAPCRSTPATEPGGGARWRAARAWLRAPGSPLLAAPSKQEASATPSRGTPEQRAKRVRAWVERREMSDPPRARFRACTKLRAPGRRRQGGPAPHAPRAAARRRASSLDRRAGAAVAWQPRQRPRAAHPCRRTALSLLASPSPPRSPSIAGPRGPPRRRSLAGRHFGARAADSADSSARCTRSRPLVCWRRLRARPSCCPTPDRSRTCAVRARRRRGRLSVRAATARRSPPSGLRGVAGGCRRRRARRERRAVVLGELRYDPGESPGGGGSRVSRSSGRPDGASGGDDFLIKKRTRQCGRR